MKRIFIVFFPFFLSGCPSTADIHHDSYPARVELQQTSLCLRGSPENDEKLEAVSFYRKDKSDEKEILFFDRLLLLTHEQCVPIPEYQFIPGVNYHFSIKFTSPGKKNAGIFPYSREFETEFYLEQDKKGLRVIVTLPVKQQ